MADTSSVILTGEVLPGHELAQVAGALARMLKTSEDNALGLLTGRETTVKRNVPAAEVERYLTALTRAGAGARAEATAPPPPPVAVPRTGAGASPFPTISMPADPPAPPSRSPVSESKPAVPDLPNLTPIVASPKPAPATAPVPAAAGMASALALEPMAASPNPATAPPVAPPTVGTAPETVDCPQCGHNQPKRTLCLKCGCDMPRMRAAQEQAKNEEKDAKTAFEAPRATLVDDSLHDEGGTFTPGLFGLSYNGRLGRLRYMAYSWGIMLPIIVAGIVAAISLPARSLPGMIFFGVAALFAAWMGLRLMALRLHDLNLSSKWVLLVIVLSGASGAAQMETVGIVLSGILMIGTFLLMAWPGSQGSNNYGPPCDPNTTLVTVGAIAFVVLQGVAVFGATAGLRSYHEYASQARGDKALDFKNPVYAEVHILQSFGGREVEMVYFGKMANDADCKENGNALAMGFTGRCKNCEVKSFECKRYLTPRNASLFEDNPTTTTYLSMTRGAANEREGRMIFWGLSSDESNKLCDILKLSMAKTQKGAVRCIAGIVPDGG